MVRVKDAKQQAALTKMEETFDANTAEKFFWARVGLNASNFQEDNEKTCC